MVDIFVLDSQLLKSKFTFHPQTKKTLSANLTLARIPEMFEGNQSAEIYTVQVEFIWREENVESGGLKSRGPLGNRAEPSRGRVRHTVPKGEEEFMAVVGAIPRPLMRPTLESESRCRIAARYEDDNLRRRLGSR